MSEAILVPATTSQMLSDLLDELHTRVRGQIEGLGQQLYWQPDPGANSCGATVWHFSRWLDVISVRLLDGMNSDDELWFALGWARMTGYDPRGLGEGGLGVLTGYTIEQVLEMPQLSSAELLKYLGNVVSRLRPQLLKLSFEQLSGDAPGVGVMNARAAATGFKNTYGWIRQIMLGSFQHVGEIAALLAMHDRLSSEA